jgi:hypothetical protein
MATQPKALRLLAALALVAALLIAAMLAGSVEPAGARVAKTLGNTARTPSPSCPGNPCEAVGRVTGFQLSADGHRGPFKARQDGTLVAWALDLSNPDDEQTDFFGDFYSSDEFGTKPTARISVLKRGDGRKYKLKRQSPVVELSSALGSRQVFTLTDPLRINQGEFLALTLPTWAPSFAVNLSGKGNVWRASRGKKKCEGTSNIKQSKPLQKVNSERRFGCDYKTARLLYWGYYVPR